MEPGDIGRQPQASEPGPGGGGGEAAAAAAAAARPSHLEIDLNEIPSPSPDSDPFDVVRSFQDAPEPPAEPAAEPVVARGGPAAACVACGEPEGGGGHVVVCDGCERGFHVACAGLARQGMDAEEWVCRECVDRGVKSRRWPLGFKSNRRRFLDMNASPPSDGDCDGEGSEDVIELR